MEQQGLNRHFTMLGSQVTTAAKTNEVGENVGLTVVLVMPRDIAKLAERLDMVNVQLPSVSFLCHAATLASVIVACAGCSALHTPVRAIVGAIAAFPHGVFVANVCFRPANVSAFMAAKVFLCALEARGVAAQFLTACATLAYFDSDASVERAFVPTHILGAPDSSAYHVAEKFFAALNPVRLKFQWRATLRARHFYPGMRFAFWTPRYPRGVALLITKLISRNPQFTRATKHLGSALRAWHFHAFVVFCEQADKCTLIGSSTFPIAKVLIAMPDLPRLALNRRAAMETGDLNALACPTRMCITPVVGRHPLSTARGIAKLKLVFLDAAWRALKFGAAQSANDHNALIERAGLTSPRRLPFDIALFVAKLSRAIPKLPRGAIKFLAAGSAGDFNSFADGHNKSLLIKGYADSLSGGEGLVSAPSGSEWFMRPLLSLVHCTTLEART